MSTKKKLSLKEFMQDEALGGGSWADDDFDPSSISVPISNQRHMHDQLHYQSNSHSVFGGRPSFQNGPQSPPFIVKLSNIPKFFGIAEIQDLFQSRFTRFVKMKLFWDIDFNVLNSSANPLDALNKRKKVSFVEVETYRDFEKVLKWNDLYLDRGMGKILVNNGNFDDFRIYNDLNQQVPEIDDPSVPSRPERRLSRPSPEAFQHPRLHRLQDQLPPPSLSPTNQANQSRPLHPLDRLAQRQSQGNFPAHQVNYNTTAHPITAHQPHELPPLRQPEPAPIPQNKPNPFGSAKPVDTLSKQLELEKTLQALEINKTTYRTLGQLEEEEKERKREAEKKKEELKKKERESAKEEAMKPESRQSPSLASLHLKKTQQQQQQNSSKTQKAELVVAPPPSVSAWASSDSNNLSNGSNTRMDSPQAKSPNSEPTKLSVSVFQGKKKNITKENETRRKVILKRKNLEHKKPEIKKGASEETPIAEELKEENNVEKASELEDSVNEEQISDSTTKPESATSQKAKFESKPQKEKAEKRQNSNNKERKPKDPKPRPRDVKKEVTGNVSEHVEDQSATLKEEQIAADGVTEDIKVEILSDSSRGRGRGPGGRGRGFGRNSRGGRGGLSERSSRESSGDGAPSADDFKSGSKREVEHDVNSDKYNGTNEAKDTKEVKPSRESRYSKSKGKKEPKQAVESNETSPQNDTKDQKEQKQAKEQKVANNSKESSTTKESKETSPFNAEGSSDGPSSASSESRRGRGRGGFRGRGRGRGFKNISKSYNKKAPEADS